MNDISAAIYCIPADDRETWVEVGMAVKSALGEDGFALWDAWSRTSERYKKSAAKAVWKSIKPYGGITHRTLFKLARDYGYRGGEDFVPPVLNRVRASEQERRDAVRRQKAAKESEMIIRECRTDHHPYLERKGFPDEPGLIDFDGRLVVPMRNVEDYRRIQSVQFISANGEKKFLPGGAAKDAVFIIGAGQETWLCEGYATGLSIRAALKALYRNARVVVCFSAANIRSVAAHMTGKTYIVADNDAHGVGAAYASQTGYRFVVPPIAGMDANDYHQKEGVFALAALLREALAQ